MTDQLPPPPEDIDMDDPRFEHLGKPRRRAKSTFDPNGPIPGETRRQQEAEFEQFKDEDYSLPGPYFRHATEVPVVAGTYRFRVEQSELKKGLEATSWTIHRHHPLVKVTLCRERLKLQTEWQGMFTACLVPFCGTEPRPGSWTRPGGRAHVRL